MDEIEKWRSELAHHDVGVRAAAAENLCQAGADAAVAAVELVQACGDENESVQTWAAAALEDLGPPAADSIDRLVKLFANENSLVVYWAVSLAGRLGQEATSSETALAAILSDSSDEAVREQAAWALGKIGATSQAAVTALDQAKVTGGARLVRLAEEALLPTRQ